MTKEQECMKALQCLYSEVPSVIADDIKQKVIDALNEVKNCTIPLIIKSLPEYNEILYHAKTLSNEQFREYWNDVQGNVL